MALINRINAGSVVLCDSCNRDGDEVTEDGLPAILGGGSVDGCSYCNDCLNQMHLPTRLVRYYDSSKSFGDNVRKDRLETYGSEDCVIEIHTWD